MMEVVLEYSKVVLLLVRLDTLLQKIEFPKADKLPQSHWLSASSDLFTISFCIPFAPTRALGTLGHP